MISHASTRVIDDQAKLPLGVGHDTFPLEEVLIDWDDLADHQLVWHMVWAGRCDHWATPNLGHKVGAALSSTPHHLDVRHLSMSEPTVSKLVREPDGHHRDSYLAFPLP